MIVGPAQFELAGRVAVVTGSTRGLGLAIARAFAAAGARVVISSEDADATRQTASDLAAEGFDATPLPCDVTIDADLQGLVDGACEQLGGIDILVCNAGVVGTPGPMSSLSREDYERVMDLNLGAAVRLTTLATPRIAQRGGGSVILMASISALRGNKAINAYALSKAGLTQLARNLAVEWGPHNVRANAIAPGFIDTELSKPLMADEAFMKRRMGMTPLRRPGRPEEIAGAALFLASPAGGFVTGQTLVVDGGTVITDGS